MKRSDLVQRIRDLAKHGVPHGWYDGVFLREIAAEIDRLSTALERISDLNWDDGMRLAQEIADEALNPPEEKP